MREEETQIQFGLPVSSISLFRDTFSSNTCWENKEKNAPNAPDIRAEEGKIIMFPLQLLYLVLFEN